METKLSRGIMEKLKSYVVTHKITSILILVVVLALGHWGYTSLTSTSGETRYVTAVVQKGTIIASISGTGQVSTSNQIDVKPKVSGDVLYVNVINGQEVKAGTLIAQLDARDAEKAVRDAEVNLESANISLQKLKQPADALSTIQTENALSQATGDLGKAYDDGFNNVSNTFLTLPAAMSGLQDIIYGTTLSKGVQDNVSAYSDMVKNYDQTVLQFKDDTKNKYQAARTAYDQNIADYKSVTRFSGTTTIEQIINETYDTTKIIAEAVKSANDLLNFVKDRLTERQLAIPSLLSTHQSSLSTYTSQTNSNLLSLSDIKNTIISSRRTIAEKTEALAKLRGGADPLDITTQELSVKQRENALLDAKNTLDEYFIRAPFDGTVAKMNVKKADSANSSTVIATVITKQQLAQISLNEVDVAKVKIGQKVTLTFDAIDGLSITGKVVDIDTVGTVTQGVVTYGVKIGFDTQDNRVKSGMSVSAAIITDIKQDVLTVPNSAIKSQGDASYVEVFDSPLAQSSGNQGAPSLVTPRQQSVQIGLSDDTSTEITSGLKEGVQIVTRTINPTQTTGTTQAPNILQATGVRGQGGAGGGTRNTTGR